MNLFIHREQKVFHDLGPGFKGSQTVISLLVEVADGALAVGQSNLIGKLVDENILIEALPCRLVSGGLLEDGLKQI